MHKTSEVARFNHDPPAAELRAAISRDGCCLVDRAISDQTVDALCDAIDAAERVEHQRTRRGSMFAIRNLIHAVPAVGTLAQAPAIRQLIDAVLGPEAFVMRAILFDKTPDANWHVGWHQDTAIAVEKRIDTDGFGPWSVKAGVQHVRPPAAVLQQVLTIRIHLDPCDEKSGALRVLPGWHDRDFIDANSMTSTASEGGDAVCSVHRGGAVLMRPLTPHASSPAERPRRRRVVHLEFASGELPGELRWMRESA